MPTANFHTTGRGRKRIIIALSISIALHAVILIGPGGKRLPHMSIRQAPRRVSMRLYRRKAAAPRRRTAPKRPAAARTAVTRTIKKTIRELPAPQIPPRPALAESPEAGRTPRPARPTLPELREQPQAAAQKPLAEDNDRGGKNEKFIPTVSARPLYRKNPPPEYPPRARLMRWQGTVLIRADINAAGRVKRAKIEASSGHGILDRAALAALKSWLFTPARRGPMAVPCQVTVPIRFELK